MQKRLRVAAYAVVVRGDEILLARSPTADGGREWVLPGGGMEHGEDPLETAVREVEEETGYRAEMTTLLGVDSHRSTLGATVDHHSLRLVYEARVTGGTLRPERNGSTDLAAWHPLVTVPALRRIRLVDTALRLWRERPDTGRVARGRGGERDG
ncbi:NUDIX domain-containing protein [Streptomyces sp. MUM 203J]|uniref:NUDIX hydrolase n=1 Tax=Streptomyces sp. MUM 203J TaxID=2791990 RepID=UPI001F04B032|nr:NUDIX domain-containing protein [Streptomyces sp. MUM 203J]MCH0541182.1 NUDIX domain-containing protein [Streptomyces sp. MUM 203J]